MFNLENKITWKELAPSLQAMFKTLQSQITDVKNEVNNINISLGDINDHLTQIDNSITNIEGDITNINNDISEINNNIEEVTNITNNITGMFATGEQGQVVKIDAENNGLFADDNFHKMNVFDNNSDITAFKNSFNYDLNMQEIFNTWQQNRSMNKVLIDLGLFDDASSNTNYVQKNTKDSNWKYTDGYIQMSLNQSSYCTFISLKEYQYKSNLSIEVIVTAIQVEDDDIVSIVIGYEDGIGENEYYTLEYNITGNHQNGSYGRPQIIYSSFLTYNLAQNGCKILLSQTKSDKFYNTSSKPTTKIKIEKSNSSVKVYRTYFYSTEKECINAPYYYSAEYTIPRNKPSDWDQDTYDRIKRMFGYSKIGFGTISWSCKFKVLNSNVADLVGGSLIYDLQGDTIQKYDNGWIVDSAKPSDEIPERTFLYNEFTNKFYFYYYKQNFVQIKGGYST